MLAVSTVRRCLSRSAEAKANIHALPCCMQVKYRVAVERPPDSDALFGGARRSEKSQVAANLHCTCAIVHDEPGSSETQLLQQVRVGGYMSSGWPVYDNEMQYRRVGAYLLPGETLYAVYDCKGIGTGFVGITDLRIIFYESRVHCEEADDSLSAILEYPRSRSGRRRGDLSERRDYHSDRFWSVRLRISQSGRSRLDLPFSHWADSRTQVADANHRVWIMR